MAVVVEGLRLHLAPALLHHVEPVRVVVNQLHKEINAALLHLQVLKQPAKAAVRRPRQRLLRRLFLLGK